MIPAANKIFIKCLQSVKVKRDFWRPPIMDCVLRETNLPGRTLSLSHPYIIISILCTFKHKHQGEIKYACKRVSYGFDLRLL